MKCASNSIPGDEKRRDVVERAIDAGIGDLPVDHYDVIAEASDLCWDIRVTFNDGRVLILRVFPERQPRDENDERKLGQLMDFVATALKH